MSNLTEQLSDLKRLTDQERSELEGEIMALQNRNTVLRGRTMRPPFVLP